MSNRNLQTQTGTFYGVGVGPGDPELLTLKAQRVLKDVSIVFVPQSETSRDSFAYSIASQFIDEEKQRMLQLLKDLRVEENELRSHVNRDEIIRNVVEVNFNHVYVFFFISNVCFSSHQNSKSFLLSTFL